MGGPYYAVQGGSRICNSNREDQSGSDNADVTGWTKTDDFILAVNINSGSKDTEAAEYKLRWRDVTDSGSFADVGATGEINYNADTVLVQGTNIPVGNRRCDSQGGDTWQAGEEVEGQSLSDSIDLADEYETEIHFALDCSSADDGHEYEFELWDNTANASRGTCGATITMAAGAQLYYQTAGEGSVPPTGGIGRKTSIPRMGSYATAMAGTLSTVGMFKEPVGQYAMSIAGSLSTIVIWAKAVGGYALSVAGGLSRKIFVSVGQYSLVSAGSLVKLTTKKAGAYAVAIVGSLSTLTRKLQTVGGYSMGIAGGIVKKATRATGGAAMTIVGTLAKVGGETEEAVRKGLHRLGQYIR